MHELNAVAYAFPLGRPSTKQLSSKEALYGCALLKPRPHLHPNCISEVGWYSVIEAHKLCGLGPYGSEFGQLLINARVVRLLN